MIAENISGLRITMSTVDIGGVEEGTLQEKKSSCRACALSKPMVVTVYSSGLSGMLSVNKSLQV